MKISYSEGDRADAEEVLGNGTTYRLIARDIRRERTGIHALIAIAVGGKILESDVFNLGRAEDRQRLAKKAHTAMGPSHREAKPLNHIIDDLLNFSLSILREWEEQRFNISEVVEGETAIEPVSFLLTPYLLRHGSTIMFAPPGAGKSYITQIMAVCVATGMSHIWEVQESPALYVNLERSQQSLERREMAIRNALGLVQPRTGLRYLHARGSSLASIARKVRRLRQEEPGLVVFLDSVSRAQSGSLNEDEPANRFIDTMNYAADSWFAIGHTPRADATHLFGCHSADTEVLTLAGWKAHSDVRLEDEVACYDKETNTWAWAKPSRLHQYHYEGEMVRLHGKSLDVLVTPAHRLLIKSRTHLNGVANIWPALWTWTTAEKLKQNQSLPCASVNMEGEWPLTTRVGPANLETLAFLRFMGWFLSEGSVAKGATGVSLAQADGPLAKRMVETLSLMGFNPRVNTVMPKPREGYKAEKKMCYIATRYAPWLASYMTAQCGRGARNKHIPSWVWKLALPLRAELFRAMMEGDGSYAKNRPGSGSYTTISPELANDFQTLATSLGVATHLTHRAPGAKGKTPVYIVLLRKAQIVGTTATHGNISKIPYSGSVYCLTVPTGAYITRRNGLPIISGNSQMFDAGEDMGVKLTSERRGDSLGICLTITKANDIGFKEPEFLALEFEKDSLVNIRHAKKDEFPDLIEEKKFRVDTITDYLLAEGASSATQIAKDTGLNRPDVVKALRQNKTFRFVGKEGKNVLYGVATHELPYT